MDKKLSAKIKSLPRKPGVYLFKDASGQILYIGKAINLRNRARSHFSKTSDIYKDELIKNISDIDCIPAADEKDTLILENELIKKYLPKYNIQWRDDKSYFWVSLSNDEWPRVLVTHQLKIVALRATTHRAENCPDFVEDSRCNRSKLKISQITGPFTNGAELKKTLRALRKILPYRTCKNSYDKPCLQWHLGLCPAHSGQSQSANRQSQSAKHEAPPSNQQYIKSLNALTQIIRLYAGEPIRIEAYDISNIHGAHATGSMIVFAGNKPKKSDYRRFRIKTVRGANDTAMLKEVLRRRLKHCEWPLPDLILIDGGRGQLNTAQSARGQWQTTNGKFKSPVPYLCYPPLAIIALAKKANELYTVYSGKTLRLNALPANLRLNFQAILNEAHRFAISYYRHLHGQTVKIRQNKYPKW